MAISSWDLPSDTNSEQQGLLKDNSSSTNLNIDGTSLSPTRQISDHLHHLAATTFSPMTLSDLSSLNSPIPFAHKVLRGSNLTLEGDGPMDMTHVSSTEASVSIHHLSTNSLGTTVHESLLLVEMPMWPGVEDLDVDVALPRTKDDPVRIILNKAAQPWSDLSEPENKHFPAIMTRKQKSLRTPTREILHEELHILMGNDGGESQLDGNVVTHQLR